VEVLANGSGLLRVNPPEPSDGDVYISAAQVKRCELITGDRIAGPRRPARRSERFASLYRIDTVNGRPAEEVADRPRFDDLPAGFPRERLALGSEDDTLRAIESLTPIGKGSRVAIVGPARSGKSETLRRVAGALSGIDGLQMFVVLAGVRPEEVGVWSETGIEPARALTLAASPDAQGEAVGAVVEQARRIAARGGDAAVLIDGLDGVSEHVARRALGSARNIADGGSLTVIATASEPLGGETTVVALDRARAAVGRFPAIDLLGSGTIRPELLIGEDGAREIVRARERALGAG
jgi:transcription termination factor Rho